MDIFDGKVRKLSSKDRLIVLSNNALSVFIVDEKYRIARAFRVDNELFLKDFKGRLKEAVQKGSFIAPFDLYLDHNDNICLIYLNKSKKRDEIYLYSQEGVLIEVLAFPKDTEGIFCLDRRGRVYAILDEATIGIFN